MGWIVAPRKICPLGTYNVTLFGKKGSVQIQLRILRWDYPQLGWTLNPVTQSIKRQKRRKAWKHRGKGHEKTEAEIRCSHKPRNTRSHQKQEEARKDYAPGFSDGAWPYQHLDLGLVTSRAERIHFCFSKLWNLWQFLKTVLGNELTCVFIQWNSAQQ